jgi:hypothetical protein
MTAVPKTAVALPVSNPCGAKKYSQTFAVFGNALKQQFDRMLIGLLTILD